MRSRLDGVDSKRFVGVLLMADVSGYTALSEHYCNAGKGGIYRLTVTLNTYIGSLIEIIYSHGGDIIKFAGDAFLALWKTDKRSFISHTIHRVIVCSLMIQQNYAFYETDAKVNLKVKLAISAGTIYFTPIGRGADMNYILFGLPVNEAKLAESLCESGEVKLAPTAWGHLYSRNYIHTVHSDGHVTVTSILYDPQEKDVSKPFTGLGIIPQMKKVFNTIESLPDHVWDSSTTLSPVDTIRKNETLCLRPNVVHGVHKGIGSELRKFMIRPLLTQIDAHQPLEFLTEMRQVSIVLITLKPRACPHNQYVTIVDNSYTIICEIVYKSMGCVNKIILFDKDIMVLVIFGLRGFKHESEAQAALKCAYSIKKTVSALDGITEMSIGITTGQMYCGVIGHPLRREFTVIGSVVNKAARLMCSFRNKITCDEVTYIKSKMSANSFILQPKTELKGIVDSGKIFEYTEDIRLKELYGIPVIPPLLDRFDEMKYYHKWIKQHGLQNRQYGALLLIGESRAGKSTLTEWMARYARDLRLNVCLLTLSCIHSATPYLALSQIVDQILGITEPVIGFQREEKIIEHLKFYSKDLCYLNDILKVRFAYSDGTKDHNEVQRDQKAKQMFTKLIVSIPETYVILLDDLQNLDPDSWDYISIMIQYAKISAILTVTRGKSSSVHSWLYKVFVNNNIRKILLGALSSQWIPALACQILDVIAVPTDLCNALQAKCKGMPGLIESFLIHLFSSGGLEMKKIQELEIVEYFNRIDLVFPEKNLLHPQALSVDTQNALDKEIQNDVNRQVSICFLTDTEVLDTNINSQTKDIQIMIQIDSLTPYQQLLLKIASVIGNVISRDLLENIMYENNAVTTAKAIKRLFSMKILTCANIRSTCKRVKHNILTRSENNNTECECNFDHNAEDNYNLPKYAFCQIMKFRKRNYRKIYYELLPMNQKKEFHARIINYLENNDQKCPACGGVNMRFSSTDSGALKRTPFCSESSIYTSTEVDNMSGFESNAHVEIYESVDITELANNNNTEQDIVSTSKSEEWNTTPKEVNASTAFSDYRLRSSLKNSTLFGKEMLQRPQKRVTLTGGLIQDDDMENNNSNNDEDQVAPVRNIRTVLELGDINDLRMQDTSDDVDNSVTEIKSFVIPLQKGVSQIPYYYCNCAELTINIYEQLIHHALKSDLKSKCIEFMIKYSYLNLLNNNVHEAIDKLEDAENKCLDNHEISKNDIKRYLAKIYSLRANAFLQIGNFTMAKNNIERASNIYHLNFYKLTDFLKFRGLISVIKLRINKGQTYKNIMRADSVYCLNVATELFSALDDYRTAKITAFQALHIIHRVECNTIDVCDVYSNILHVEINRGTTDVTKQIEKMASNTLKNLLQPVKAFELSAVGRLHMATFKSRLIRAQINAAIRSGIKSLTISKFLHAQSVSLEIVPDLFYCLLAAGLIGAAMATLTEILHLDIFPNVESEMWYYALCIDLILDTGYQLESPNEISRFAELNISRSMQFQDSCESAKRRLVIGLWTYWLRADCEARAKRFEKEALSWAGYESEESFMSSLFSSLRLCEAMLECLARKLSDLRKVVDIMELKSVADRELSRVETDARFCRIIFPRWMMLKAYSLSLSSRPSSNMFAQALEEARKMQNKLEESQILAASQPTQNHWRFCAAGGKFKKWIPNEHSAESWHKMMYKITTYQGALSSRHHY